MLSHTSWVNKLSLAAFIYPFFFFFIFQSSFKENYMCDFFKSFQEDKCIERVKKVCVFFSFHLHTGSLNINCINSKLKLLPFTLVTVDSHFAVPWWDLLQCKQRVQRGGGCSGSQGGVSGPNLVCRKWSVEKKKPITYNTVHLVMYCFSKKN